MAEPKNILIKGITEEGQMLATLQAIEVFNTTDANKYADDQGRTPAIKVGIGKKNWLGKVDKPTWDFFVYKTPEYYVVDISAFVPDEEIENGKVSRL